MPAAIWYDLVMITEELSPDQEIRNTIERLVDRGSEFDLASLEDIYDPAQYILFVRAGGTIDRVPRAQTLDRFRELRQTSAPFFRKEFDVLQYRNRTRFRTGSLAPSHEP
ncbi:MAG: hypothetical protein ACR2NN_02575 [Bryobacteraceae bacterium]